MARSSQPWALGRNPFGIDLSAPTRQTGKRSFQARFAPLPLLTLSYWLPLRAELKTMRHVK